MNLDLESEPYAPTGNISGRGVERSLGTPTLDHLQILVRETVQNAWDARLEDAGGVDFKVAVRTLAKEQSQALRELLRELPAKGKSREALKTSLEAPEISVIEIADYGTSGLGGPTRADKIAEGIEKSDFANFFRNVGSPRDRHLGGGTYGYGKSAAYVVSRCRTIIAYSATTNRGKSVARLMAANLGEPFEYRSRNFTGRHWWGRRAADNVVDPMEKDKAHRAAKALGLSVRGEFERGTTLLIVDPGIEGRTLNQAANSIAEGLAWYFWPKMLDRGDGKPSMRFSVSANGLAVAVPDPSNFPPLAIFADAMKMAKGGAAQKIVCERPKRHLGVLGLSRGPRLSRVSIDTGIENSPIPNSCSHIALMRPAELVVKYLAGPPLPSDMVEYAGVFICDDDVEHEFALAEPPAHDDWIPDYLEGHAKTFVKVALRRISDAADRFANPALTEINRQNEDLRSLAGLADALGGVLAGQTGQRVGVDRANGRQAVPRPATVMAAVRLSETEPFRFAVVRKKPCALFRIRATGSVERIKLRAIAGVILEGSSSLTDAAAMPAPEVVAWLDSSGETRAFGAELETAVDGELITMVAVSIPGDCAVAVDVQIVSD